MNPSLFNVSARLVLNTAPQILLAPLGSDGLCFEWNVEKVIGPSSNLAQITIYNLDFVARQRLLAFRSVPGALIVALSVGWGNAVEPLFVGEGWRVVAQEIDGVDIVTRIEAGDMAISDAPAAGGSLEAVGMATAIIVTLKSIGLVPTPSALAMIDEAVFNVPLAASIQATFDLPPREQLNYFCASLGLSWGIEDGAFVVYRRGLINDGSPPSILTAQSGLLRWAECDGGVEFEAVAQPRVKPGSQVFITNTRNVTIGGGPLRVERVTFSGSTESHSLMSGVAKRVWAL